ncbi:MAG: 2-oxo acid dehydrogenase subunit E2 [Proteobacteria bacterium]|nr:2-oxo acid dehydrogenase subunit E2 [Pseudomonadota bacterium]
MATTVRMPQLGESVVEGTVGRWCVQVGERIDKDQVVVEILTDKADSELPSPVSGVLAKIVAEEGATVAVGDVLCEIDSEAAVAAAPTLQAAATQPVPEMRADPGGRAPETSAPKRPHGATVTVGGSGLAADTITSSLEAGNGSTPRASTEALAASPAVRKMAREHGVDLGEVRVTRDEVLRAAQGLARITSSGTAAAERARPSSGAFKVEPYIEKTGDEIVPFSRRRRIIADHMVYSQLTAPHVVTVAECDLQRTSKLREGHKAQFKREGLSLTYLAFVATAVAGALREHPIMNARVLDDAYVLLSGIHLGIAVETSEGLVVPVVRNADDLTVRGMARAVDDVAKRAREGKLTPDDLAAKTFTISNPGRLGNLYGAAIISQPNVGILRIGEIKKRPVVVEVDGDDVITIHPVMHMALSYDHRIVDGVAANAFLNRIGELLESGSFQV